MTVERQICKTCGQDKPASAYYRQKSKRSGLFAECKTCNRARNEKWVNSNRERFRHINKVATANKRRRDPVRAMLCLARARAKKRGIEFTLTTDDVSIPAVCPVLGIPLSFGLGEGRGQSLQERDGRASLDRIDNTKGYTPDNVIVVSYRANRLKSDATKTELLKIARFYARLETDPNGEAVVSAVQQHPKEQEGSLLECDPR